MPEPGAAAASGESQEQQPVPEWLRDGLHELSQPLSALELLLYLGVQEDAGDGSGPEDRRAQYLREAQVQCARMLATVRAMQQRMSYEM